LLRWVTLFHLATAALMFTLPISLAWQTSFMMLAAASLLHQHRHLRRRIEIIRQSSGLWLWREEGNAALEVEVLADCYVSPWLVVFTCREIQRRRRHSLVVWSDSLPAEQLRRLRVALRQEACAAAQPTGR